jgi:hypothetical protein
MRQARGSQSNKSFLVALVLSSVSSIFGRAARLDAYRDHVVGYKVGYLRYTHSWRDYEARMLIGPCRSVPSCLSTLSNGNTYGEAVNYMGIRGSRSGTPYGARLFRWWLIGLPFLPSLHGPHAEVLEHRRKKKQRILIAPTTFWQRSQIQTSLSTAVNLVLSDEDQLHNSG